jgi:orotate phosphoribosyltransferase
MTFGTSYRDEAKARKWSDVAAGLRAIVDFGSRLSHRYPSVDFDSPSALRVEQLRAEGPLRWRSSAGATVWLKVSGRALTIGVQLAPAERAGRLVFWGILDPICSDNSLFGVMVSRRHEKNAVGKTIRPGEVRLGSESLCVLVTADLSRVADKCFLSLAAKGFSEAAMDDDRDAWIAWLWNEASQGHLKISYVKRLGTKVLGRHMRQASESTPNDDPIDVLRSLAGVGVFERGADYKLPSGLHAAAHVNLGAACGHPAIIQKLARRVAQIVEEKDYDTIVSTSWTVAMIAREVIRLRPMTRVGVVRHAEYEGVQPLPLTPVTPRGRAVILTDVVVTGGLIKRVSDIVRAAGTEIAEVVVVVDARGTSTNRVTTNFKSACEYDVQAVASGSCPRCGHLELREFNPVACCMTDKKMEPRSPGEFLAENLEAADFWNQVDRARAYEHHRMEGNTHYVSFIDTAKLLTHETVGPTVVGKLVARLSKLRGTPDVIVFPGSRARSRLLAEHLRCGIVDSGRLWPPNMVGAKQAEGRFQITASDAELIKGARVLLADTAVASGSTLEELTYLANSAGAASVSAMVIVSRVSDSQEAAISTRFGGQFYRLYQLPIRPRTIPDALKHLCPVCRRREDIEKAASESRFEPIEALSNELRSRRARRPSVSGRPVTSRDRQLRLMAQAEVPLLEHCRRSTASGVTLHSLHAAMNNGMAPLRLPEIRDDRIPAPNRSAMIEYLGSDACAWSGSALLMDARRSLDEGDLDDIWTQCAALLNRGSSHYWVEALESKLATCEGARQQESSGLWNRLAFEVYRLVKSDPSSLPELSLRFHSMWQTCAHTPAESGIKPIVEMLGKLAKPSSVPTEEPE